MQMWSCSGVKFKCPTCRQELTIAVKYFQDKKSVICSCCDYEFSNEIVSNMQLSIKHAALAYEHIKDNNLSGLVFDFIPASKDN